MAQRLTSVKFTPGLPGSSQGAFPLPIPVPFVAVTVLRSTSLPGFPYLFSVLAASEIQRLSFSGRVAPSLNWQAQIVGVQDTPIQPAIPVTVLGSYTLPKFAGLFSAANLNQLTLVGSVAGPLIWQGQVVGTENAGAFPFARITTLKSSSLPGGPNTFSGTTVNTLTTAGTPARPLLWQALLLGDEGEIFMTKQFCQVGDTGLQLIYQFVDQNLNPINLVGASALKLKILYPDATTVDKTATFFTNGTDGKIVYTTLSNDLAQAGLCKLQGKYTLGGQTLSGQEVDLEVLPNVDNT